jgi:hypothetical protein
MEESGARVLSPRTGLLLLLVVIAWACHAQAPSAPAPASPQPDDNANRSRFARNVLDLFHMAGAEPGQFRPLTFSERSHLYLRSMINPLSFVRVAASAGIDQAKDKPEEWEQGASGYGKRYANIFGQYSIQRTVTWGMSCALHEDNRYFNSGKHGFWPRSRYAVESGILARRDDGSRRFSFSQVGGTAAGAFLARPWLPPSQSSAADGAESFAISLGTNVAFSFVKEFLPDIARPLIRKR